MGYIITIIFIIVSKALIFPLSADLICFKADFMESAGAHNTGAANFIDNIAYKNVGMKTPGQNHFSNIDLVTINYNALQKNGFTYKPVIEKKEEIVTFDDASEHVEGYAAFVTENPYRDELNSFLKQIVDRNYTPAWDFEKDKAVLDIIDQIEA